MSKNKKLLFIKTAKYVLILAALVCSIFLTWKYIIKSKNNIAQNLITGEKQILDELDIINIDTKNFPTINSYIKVKENNKVKLDKNNIKVVDTGNKIKDFDIKKGSDLSEEELNLINAANDDIKKSLDKVFKITYTIEDETKIQRQVKISMNKDEVWDSKNYFNYDKKKILELGAAKQAYVIPQEAISPRKVIKNNLSDSSKLNVIIDATKLGNVGKLKNIYINNVSLEKNIAELGNGKIYLSLPGNIPEGKYDISFENDKSIIFTGKEILEVQNYKPIEEYSFGKIRAKGQVSNNEGNIVNLTNDIYINSNLKISGQLKANRESMLLEGNGLIYASIDGGQLPFYRGNFVVDGNTGRIMLKDDYIFEYDGFKLSIKELEVNKDGEVTGKGNLVANFTTDKSTLFPISNLNIGYNDLNFSLNNFNYSNEYINIKDTTLIYKNGNWSGLGNITLKDEKNNITTFNKPFTMRLDDDYNTFNISEIGALGAVRNNFDLEGMGFKFTSEDLVIVDVTSERPLLATKGRAISDSEYAGNKLQGDLAIAILTDNKKVVKGNIYNNKVKIKIDGNYQLDEPYYGYGEVTVNDKTLGNFKGSGNLMFSKKKVYGLFKGEIYGKENQIFQIDSSSILLLKNEESFIKNSMINENPSINSFNPNLIVKNVVLNGDKLNIQWKIENAKNFTNLDIFYAEENSENLQLLKSNVRYNDNKNGVTLDFKPDRPGKYYLYAKLNNKGTLIKPLYIPVDVKEKNVPSKIIITKSYMAGDDLNMDLNLSKDANLDKIKVIQYDKHGNLNTKYNKLIDKNSKVTLTAVNKEVKYALVGVNTEGKEGYISDIIDLDKLSKERALFKTSWNEKSNYLNTDSIKLGLLFTNTNSIGEIYLNNHKIDGNITESGIYPIKLEEGFNEIKIKASNGSEHSEFTKEYTVNTKSPSVDIKEPFEQRVSSSKNVTITGDTEPNYVVSINSKKLQSDAQGKFREKYTLGYGSNIIRTLVSDKNGDSTEYVTEILYYGNIKIYIFISVCFVLAGVLITIYIYHKKHRIKG